MSKTSQDNTSEAKTSEAKSSDALEPAGFKDALIERQDAALRFMSAQATSPKWMVLPGSRSVVFSELRGGMCRWPIGEPQHHEAFRFCGRNCLSGDSYCAAHKKMAFAPGKAARAASVAGNSPARPRSKAQGQV